MPLRAARVWAEYRGSVLHLDKVIFARVVGAVRLAAQPVRAPGSCAHGGIGLGDLGVVVGARVVRAKRLTALGNLARVAFARHVHSVFDGGVAGRAPYGVAVLRLPHVEEVKTEAPTDVVCFSFPASYYTTLPQSLSRVDFR